MADDESGDGRDGDGAAAVNPDGVGAATQPVPVVLVQTEDAEAEGAEGEGVLAEDAAVPGENEPHEPAAHGVVRTTGHQTATPTPTPTAKTGGTTYQEVAEKLRLIPEQDWVILIVGYSDAGKSFFVDQAKAQCKTYFDADASEVLVSGQARHGGGSASTKDIEKTTFSRRKSEDRTCRARTFHLIDIPGEWFGQLIGISDAEEKAQKGVSKLLELRDETKDELRQLLATVAMADALILVVNGPAASQVRTRKAPEKFDAPAGTINDAEWDKFQESVTRSLDVLGPLSSFLRVVSAQRSNPVRPRIDAFGAVLAMPEAPLRAALTAESVSCPAPLFVTMTKADQIFGFGDDEVSRITITAPGRNGPRQVVLDCTDPWLSLLSANAGVGNRDPYSSIGRFKTVNLDFSSASPGGAQQRRAADGTESFKICDGQLGLGRGTWEAIDWLLERIADQHDAAEARADTPGPSATSAAMRFIRRWFTSAGLLSSPRIYASAIERRREFDGEFRKLVSGHRP